MNTTETIAPWLAKWPAPPQVGLFTLEQGPSYAQFITIKTQYLKNNDCPKHMIVL